MKKTLFIIFTFCCLNIYAQNLSQYGKKQGIKVTGGIGANTVTYIPIENAPVRSPFTYFLTGNLNVNLYGVAIPLSFAYSNQNFAYTTPQPFNIIGLSPTYKNVTVHLGYRNMTFSPYSLAGVQYFGGGAEVKIAQNWKVMAMYGRLRKEVAYDSLSPNRLANYRRMGTGAKVEYTAKGNKISLAYFTGWDLANSLAVAPDKQNVKPEENGVWNIEFSKTLFKHLTFSSEYARSSYSTDNRIGSSTENKAFYESVFLVEKRLNTRYYNAFKGNVMANMGHVNIGVGYERIDPGYKTLGAYYFNNDLENVTVNTAISLFKRKANITASVGKQHDNLNNEKTSTQKRNVGSFALNLMPIQKLTFNVSYSNFSTFMNILPQYRKMTALTAFDNLDTLNYVQVAESYSGNVNWQLKATEKGASVLNYSTSYQQTGDKRGATASVSNLVPGTKIQNHSLNFSKTITPLAFSCNLGVNANIMNSAVVNNLLTGPSLNLTKGFFNKKLNTTLGGTYNLSFDNRVNTSKLFSLRNSYSTTLQKKHTLSLSLVYVNSLQKANVTNATLTTFSNMTISAGYNYSFSVAKK